MLEPALALVEFNSIAIGIQAGDAMIKKAPIAFIKTGTVHPGKYLVLIGGEVADVLEALQTGLAVGAAALMDHVFLPGVHPDVVAAVAGGRQPNPGEALGVIETRTAAATIHAADAGVKGAMVRLLEVRLADGLGGKGFVLFGGAVADVEAAVDKGVGVLADKSLLVSQVVIPALHAEMVENIAASTRFRERTGSL